MFNLYESLNELAAKVKAPITKGIQSQYRNTNIQKLIEGIIAIRSKYIINAYESMLMHNFNLTSAKGDGLDLWGQILNFYRYMRMDSLGGIDVTLEDDQFRRLLFLLFQKQFIKGDIQSANDFVDSILGGFADVTIKDSHDMSYMFYIFNERIPNWLYYCLKEKDILPRPACVGVSVEHEVWAWFGFAPDDSDKETNPEKYQTRVAWFENKMGNFDGSVWRDYSTIDEWKERQEWFARYMGNFDNSIFDKSGVDSLAFGFAPEREGVE